MKVIRILFRSIRDAFRSVFRNFSLSIASVTCTIITLILVGIAIVLSYNVNSFTKDLERDLTIVVFANREATTDQIKSIESNIRLIDNVDKNNVNYLSKNEVKNKMAQESDVYSNIMNSWTDEENPLQDTYEIKVIDVGKISSTAAEIKKIANVDAVKYGEGMVDQLVSVFGVVEKGTIGIVIALIIVTAFLIANTIKLTIFSRRNEIEIMRLVGTSNLTIRLPFIFEGCFLGIIGSIIPIILIIYGYVISYDKLGGHIFSNIINLVEPFPFCLYVALGLLLIGSLVGMVGSYRAVRKYLKI